MDKEIVRACIKYKNKLFTGFDHGECFESLLKEEQPKDMTELEQGFIDNELNFVDRQSAMVIANIAGQLKFKPIKETLISEDLHLDWLNRQAKQIADLEAKLAESEKEVASLQCLLFENANDRKAMQEFKIGEYEYDLTDEDARNSLCWEVEELKQQLAEKEKAVESLQEINQSLGQTCNNDAKEIDRLREQLAEKEKEETKRMQDFEKECQEYYKSTKRVIDELEKVKEWANNMYDGWKSNDGVNLDEKTGICNTLQAVCGMVNQQIKSLKGKK